MSVNFEYTFEELDNNELRINTSIDIMGKINNSIIINKSWITWIIATLRTATIDDYEIWHKEFSEKYQNCELALMMHPAETQYSYIGIFPIWKDEKKRTPGIEIPYLSWSKSRLMSEFIEPFLVDLSKFLTEEERNALPKPWAENEQNKEDTNDEEGHISLKFVQEIDPKDYFG